MSEILSQAEIDELLNALTSGAEPEAEEEPLPFGADAKVYDFRKANKFQKEHMRTINIVFQTFSQLLANRLSSMMRTNCECEIMTVEEQSFNEWNNSLPSPVILGVLKMPPMRGSTLIQISPEIAYSMINRLFGGTVESDSSKQFTEIELTLINKVLRQMLEVFPMAWEKIIKLEALLERVETSSQFTQVVALNEAIAIILLDLKIGDSNGLVSFCIPYASMEPILSQLNTLLLFSGAADEEIEQNPELITERLYNTPVNLTACFTETPAKVIDIMRLQRGDVIRLKQRTDEPLMVKVEHIPKFIATIGTAQKKYAVQVVDIINEEENPDE